MMVGLLFFLLRLCRGIDRRPVLPNRIRKSIGAENTFSRDLTSLDDMRAELDPLVDKVWHYCESIGVRGRTVTLKVKFADFQIITRSRSYITPISDRSTLGINQRGVTRGAVSHAQRSSSPRRVALFVVRRCRRRRSANDSGIVSRRRRSALDYSPAMGCVPSCHGARYAVARSGDSKSTAWSCIENNPYRVLQPCRSGRYRARCKSRAARRQRDRAFNVAHRPCRQGTGNFDGSRPAGEADWCCVESDDALPCSSPARNRGRSEKLRVRLLLLPAPSANDFDGAFAAMVQERADAFLVVPSPLSTSYRSALAELALKHRLPAMYGHRDYVEAGGLMSYGADIDDLNRRTALYIDKILKGANLPTCPWSRPTIHQSIYCIEPTGAAMVNTNGAERGSCF